MLEDLEKYNSEDQNPKSNQPTRHLIGLQGSKKEEKIEEQKLWIKLKLGSEEGFRELFLKYNAILGRIGRIISNDSVLIEDCIHDLFIYLWSKRESLAEVEFVKYYLIVAFRRRLYKLLSEKEKGAKILEGIKFEYPKYENFFESKYINQQQTIEKERALKRAVDLLPARQKELLRLRYLEGLSYQEISNKMGISNVSARKLSSKAIKALRKLNL